MRQKPFVAEPSVGYKSRESLVDMTAMALKTVQRQTGTAWEWAQEEEQELEQELEQDRV